MLYFNIFDNVMGIFIGILLVISPIMPMNIELCLIAGFILVTLVAVLSAILKSMHNEKTLAYLDRLKPSIKNIIYISGQYMFVAAIMCLATYIPVRILVAANIVTMSSWIKGTSTSAIWFFLFELLKIYTTQYTVDSERIIIYQGLDTISLPLDSLETVHLTSLADIPWERKLRTRSLFIVGIQKTSRQLIQIKWRPKVSLDKNFFSEIYITPTDPAIFYLNIQDKLKVKILQSSRALT